MARQRCGRLCPGQKLQYEPGKGLCEYPVKPTEEEPCSQCKSNHHHAEACGFLFTGPHRFSQLGGRLLKKCHGAYAARGARSDGSGTARGNPGHGVLPHFPMDFMDLAPGTILPQLYPLRVIAPVLHRGVVTLPAIAALQGYDLPGVHRLSCHNLVQ